MVAEFREEGASALTARLLDALRTRFAWPEWALFEEISLSARSYSSSRADAIALGMWGSSQHHLQGFEVKASRSDWLKEVRTIGKADDAYRYCHRWWLVAPEGVATADEIPGTWGWMIPRGATLRVKRQAPVLQPLPLPAWATAHLVARALERGIARRGDHATQLREEYQRGRADGIAEEERRYHPEEMGRLREAVDRFEKASGIHIESWNGEAIGKAAGFVQAGGLKRQRQQLERAAEAALEALLALSDVVPAVTERVTYSRRRAVDLDALLAGIREVRADG